MSYTSQNAWILNCSLRDNVVLAGSYSEAAYQRVLRCCSLLPDLNTLPAGAMPPLSTLSTSIEAQPSVTSSNVRLSRWMTKYGV